MLTDEREAMSESKFNFSHFHGIEYNLYFFYISRIQLVITFLRMKKNQEHFFLTLNQHRILHSNHEKKKEKKNTTFQNSYSLEIITFNKHRTPSSKYLLCTRDIIWQNLFHKGRGVDCIIIMLYMCIAAGALPPSFCSFPN